MHDYDTRTRRTRPSLGRALARRRRPAIRRRGRRGHHYRFHPPDSRPHRRRLRGCRRVGRLRRPRPQGAREVRHGLVDPGPRATPHALDPRDVGCLGGPGHRTGQPEPVGLERLVGDDVPHAHPPHRRSRVPDLDGVRRRLGLRRRRQGPPGLRPGPLAPLRNPSAGPAAPHSRDRRGRRHDRHHRHLRGRTPGHDHRPSLRRCPLGHRRPRRPADPRQCLRRPAARLHGRDPRG